jgi:hypothetical protein
MFFELYFIMDQITRMKNMDVDDDDDKKKNKSRVD